MTYLLILVLGVSTLTMFSTLALIGYELGWLPYGRDRSPNLIEGKVNTLDLQISQEIAGQSRLDLRIYHPWATIVRHRTHSRLYEIANPKERLTEALERFLKDPTLSHRDDLINIMNGVTASEEMQNEAANITEEIIKAIVSADTSTLRISRAD